jgi:uracil-DNA glycosylase
MSETEVLTWEKLQKIEFAKPYFKNLKQFLENEIKNGEKICPSPQHFYKAFDLCPWEQTKVIILGQDPYHGLGQAHGLSFSVPNGIKPPPSLANIFKELEADINFKIPHHGNLESWAKQGVLLLNNTLSVGAKSPASHQGQGWEIFTDNVIHTLSEKKTGLVFLLWGKFAQSKKELINSDKHLILEAAHPSPFSAHKGFFGCQHFSKTNTYLTAQQKQPINWQI